MTKKFFPLAYGRRTQEEIDELYDQWADSYNEEVVENGYVTPQRIASHMAKIADPEKPILDIGCGTGLSGYELVRAGFKNISGFDVNQNMLDHAQNSGIYKQVWQADLNNLFDFEFGTYDAMAAVGVISSGAGPASMLDQALDKLNPGGVICFSYNDHTLTVDSYLDAVEQAQSSGKAELILEEYGPHLEKLGVGATVYALKKL